MASTVKDLKRYDVFTLKPFDDPTEKDFWVRDEYDRNKKRYLIYNYANVNKYKLVKGSQVVYNSEEDFI